MTETDTKAMVTTITAQDKRALRSADRIAFYLTEGQGRITAFKDGENTADGFDARHDVYADATLADYAGRGDLTDYTGYHYHSHPQRNPMIQTLVNRLTVGDTLTLRWVAANDSENLRVVGWHRDELYLVINHRHGKPQTYLVAVTTGPDNTARMIRRIK